MEILRPATAAGAAMTRTAILNALTVAALTVLLALASSALGPWLDGQPSDLDAERASAANLQDALAAARRAQHIARAEAQMKGPL